MFPESFARIVRGFVFMEENARNIRNFHG